MHTSNAPDGFSIIRFLSAPIDSVWNAWTDPNAMGTWWHTRHTVPLPVEQGTLVFFELRGPSGAPGDHFFYDGWAEALDSLNEYLTAHHGGA